LAETGNIVAEVESDATKLTEEDQSNSTENSGVEVNSKKRSSVEESEHDSKRFKNEENSASDINDNKHSSVEESEQDSKRFKNDVDGKSTDFELTNLENGNNVIKSQTQLTSAI